MKNARSFAEFYSISEYELFSLHMKSSPENKTPRTDPTSLQWSEKYKTHGNVLKVSIKDYLTELKNSTELHPIPFSERRHHRWADAWNRFLANEPSERDMNTIIDPIHTHLLLKFLWGAYQTNENKYSAMTKSIDIGCLEPWEFGGSARFDCDVTGKPLQIQIQSGWNPVLGETTRVDKNFVIFHPLTEDAPSPVVISREIQVPSGELLVADWFRIQSGLFTKIVDEGKTDFNINTAAGCQAQTNHYAENFGFISVFVGNSSPQIIARDDHFLIGRADEDARVDESDENSARLLRGAAIGRVITDLWWVTMIDRQVLVDVLSRSIPRVEAEQAVADYLKKEDVKIVKMSPGPLHFHYTAQRGDLANFAPTGFTQVNFDAVDEPFTVLSRTPLNWEKNNHIEKKHPGPR